MRCLDGITDLTDMNELGQTLRDTEACHGQSMGSRRVGHDLATEQQQRLPKGLRREVKQLKKLPAETFPRKGYIKRCQPKGTIYSHTTKGWRQTSPELEEKAFHRFPKDQETNSLPGKWHDPHPTRGWMPSYSQENTPPLGGVKEVEMQEKSVRIDNT